MSVPFKTFLSPFIIWKNSLSEYMLLDADSFTWCRPLMLMHFFSSEWHLPGSFSRNQSLSCKDGILCLRFQQFIWLFCKKSRMGWVWEEKTELLREVWHLSIPEREWKDASLRGRGKPAETFSLPQRALRSLGRMREEDAVGRSRGICK